MAGDLDRVDAALSARVGVRGRLATVVDGFRSAVRKSPLSDVSRRLVGFALPGKSSGFGGFYRWSFLVCVVLPFALGLIYFRFLAQDQYEVETRFAVRGLTERLPGAEKIAAGTSLTEIIGLTNSRETYLVAEYLRSRALIDEVSTRLDLRDMFGWPRLDVWARFSSDPSGDAMVAYWRRMVTLTIDPVSGVAILKVRAFRDDDALALSRVVITLSERYLNEKMLSMRAQAGVRADEGILRASRRLEMVEERERQFRERAGVIDADKATKATYVALFKLIARKSLVGAQLSVLQQSGAGDAPTAKPLQDTIAAIDVEIEKIKSELSRSGAGDGDAQTLSRVLSEYADVSVQRQFAEDEFAAAQNILQGTLSGQAQRRLFLEPYVPPAPPSLSNYPDRPRSLIMILLLGMSVWAGLALVAKEIEDHSD